MYLKNWSLSTCLLVILLSLFFLPLHAASDISKTRAAKSYVLVKKEFQKKKVRKWRLLEKIKKVFSKKKIKKFRDPSRKPNLFGLLALFVVAANFIAILLEGYGFFLITIPIILLLSLLGIGMDGDKTLAWLCLVYALVWSAIIIGVIINCRRNGCF